jgi:hypothetical protein
MVRIIITAAFLAAICIGCATSGPLVCSAPPNVTTFIISPVDITTTVVEEVRYNHLPPILASATEIELKEAIANTKLFNNVLTSSECTDDAVRLAPKMYSLIHHLHGFHVNIRAQLIDCRSGNILLTITRKDESDAESAKLPEQIARRMVQDMKEYLFCKRSNKQ